VHAVIAREPRSAGAPRSSGRTSRLGGVFATYAACFDRVWAEAASMNAAAPGVPSLSGGSATVEGAVAGRVHNAIALSRPLMELPA
jgi:hypothetical protein